MCKQIGPKKNNTSVTVGDGRMWHHLPDNDVRHIWHCEASQDCENVANVSPDWYNRNGTPVCENCDIDMVYVKTVVRI